MKIMFKEYLRSEKYEAIILSLILTISIILRVYIIAPSRPY